MVVAESDALSIAGLHAGYGPANVLDGVDLEVRPGELVALVGANGAGKSTLLKCISGLVRARAGEIAFRGVRLDRLAPPEIVRLGVAHVPERRQVFGQQTVQDNLVLGAYANRAGLTPRALEARIDEACRSFPVLVSRRGMLAGALSGGQQQMLAIARGLMLQPRLLLLDEPSLGLAPILVDEIFQVLSRLRERGIGILLVEQNARSSLAIADRAYVLERGRVVLTGTGQDLLRAPEVADLYLGGAAAPHTGRRAERVGELSRRLSELLGSGG